MRNAVLLVLLSAICTFAHGQGEENVLWNFGGVANDGIAPSAGLIADGSGNLYGTTQAGGNFGYGTVFELSPQHGGSWTETILYSFCANLQTLCLDGAIPLAGLVLDSTGNLYGTTQEGGAPSGACGSPGCGTVFELSPPSTPGGAWTETVLYNFCAQCKGQYPDGWYPDSTLVFDASGNLYGTTRYGGLTHGRTSPGIVFELSPGTGGWRETILYTFCSQGSGNFCPDGYAPYAGVVFGPDGNLYGTTTQGGGKRDDAAGVVYELLPGASGWTEQVLISQYASTSVAPVSFSSAGNLFGTTLATGFELNAKERTSRSVLFNASQVGNDSKAGVLVDGPRNALFGTTSHDGPNLGGSLWEVTPSRQLVALYSFCSQPNCTDGQSPLGELMEDQSGKIYGTTYYGGAYGKGVVFEVTP